MNENSAAAIRIAYFGTPKYAVPALEALDALGSVEIALVVTQPDRPVGRHRVLTPPPVKVAAESLGLPVYQPESLRSPADRAPIAAQLADLFVVAAYGKIFGPKMLSLPAFGCVNLHASLLPAYRGASPISAAILEGRAETGVTLMMMDTGLDTGAMLARRALVIAKDDTTASLTPRLAALGAELAAETLFEVVAGRIAGDAQDDAAATITRPLVKADGWIEWTQPAEVIQRHVRAMWDWPRAWTTVDGESLQVHEARVLESEGGGEPGTVTFAETGLVVATGEGSLELVRVQRSGGKPQPGKEWFAQSKQSGLVFGTTGRPEMPSTPMIRAVER